jgi:hypothetical protein
MLLLRNSCAASDGNPHRLRIAFEPLEIGAQLAGVLITHLAIFFQSLVNDLF